MDARPPRQNTIIAHEPKQVVEHALGDALYQSVGVMAAEHCRRYVAEFFAVCSRSPAGSLSPNGTGERDVQRLESSFETTPGAMLFRLEALRLAEPYLPLLRPSFPG